MLKPETDEYNPYYQSYFDLVSDGEIIQVLRENSIAMLGFFRAIPLEKANYRYAPEKWTVKEVINHLTDTERIFAYRALVAARMDTETNLATFDENHYADNADVSHRSLVDLIDEFDAVRRTSVYLLANLTEEQSRWKAHNGKWFISPRAVACFIIGHGTHHVNILEERYLR